MFNLCPPKLKNEQKSSLTTIILITNFSFLDGRHVPQQPEQPQQRRLPMLLHRHIRKLLNFHLNNFLLNRYLKQLLNFHLNKCFINGHIKKLLNCHLTIFLFEKKIASSSVPSHFRFKLDLKYPI
jgi:hypothetical protein